MQRGGKRRLLLEPLAPAWLSHRAAGSMHGAASKERRAAAAAAAAHILSSCAFTSSTSSWSAMSCRTMLP